MLHFSKLFKVIQFNPPSGDLNESQLLSLKRFKAITGTAGVSICLGQNQRVCGIILYCFILHLSDFELLKGPPAWGFRKEINFLSTDSSRPKENTSSSAVL
jgi:hypothetical protein